MYILNREKVLKYILFENEQNNVSKEKLDERNKEGIEKYRKGNFTLKFGAKIKDVKITQTKHKFKFGSTAFMLGSFESLEKQPIYEEKFAKIFNQAIVPLYWSDLEPEEGRLRFDKNSEKIYRRPPVDECLEFCDKYGLEPKGHCLTWDWFNPKWLSKYNEEERKSILERRFKQISEKYADKIPSFDVVNESATSYNHGRKVLFENYDEYALKLGDKYFKNNIKIINEAGPAIWENFSREGKYCAFNMQLKELLANNYTIDEIGLQYHIMFPEKTVEEIQNFVYLNTEFMLEVLDMFGRYNLPMHISEITIPSYANKIPENEELQAEITEIMYKTWFATENMKSIVWWNMVDGYAAYAPIGSSEGENYYCGGLLHFDLSDKPVYKVLDRLINHEWKTNVSQEVNSDTFTFRGFYGEYEIDADGKKYKVNLDKNDLIKELK